MAWLPAQLGAQEKPADAGQQVFASNCAGCHGSDAHGGERAPNLATVRSVISKSDDDLESIVKKGLPGLGMPPFAYLGDDKVKGVVAYLRVLQGKTTASPVTGDSAAGRALFFGKAQCSNCHMVRGDGGFMASDLSTYGDGQASAAIQHTVVAHAPLSAPRGVQVTTRSGDKIVGALRAEDNFSVTLLSPDGRFHSYDRTKVADIQYTSESLLPKDYASRLSATELDDLASFLITTAAQASAAEKPAKRRQR
ncbi:c-type cytochrome [Terriglobus saanensis]|uniref:Cytochrome c class I n=1 Tax=Terriglobus saanensis (strain ATCC BAA-1853 / DSM 23119 / SP1PR4) TaxID=401053 RepID=E8V2B9_TERSS|nr:c-type cytochrome [Terriglobus saanensis]ADV81252.1 cytochrome c class I [Terriglobus saanensis SP1PR4]